jgi:hypothetical protein
MLLNVSYEVSERGGTKYRNPISITKHPLLVGVAFARLLSTGSSPELAEGSSSQASHERKSLQIRNRLQTVLLCVFVPWWPFLRYIRIKKIILHEIISCQSLHYSIKVIDFRKSFINHQKYHALHYYLVARRGRGI